MNKTLSIIISLIFLQALLFPVYGKAETDSAECSSITDNSVPSDPAERFKTGYCHFEKGNYSRAAAHLKGLENSLGILNDYILYFRASSLAKSGNTGEALNIFGKFLKEHSSSVLYKEALEQTADIHFKKGDYETAVREYNQLTAMEESSWLKSRYINRIGEIYERTGMIKQAMETYKQIWTNYPQTNYSDKAVELSNKHGIDFTPTVAERRKRAEVLFDIGLREQALREYIQLPASDEVNTKIAICLYYTDRQQEALKILNEINSAEADFWRGKILEKNSFIEDAVRSYYSSYLFFPASKYAQRALMTAAELNKSRNEFDQAMKKYRALLKSHPNGQYALDAAWNIGWIHYLNGNYEKSLAAFSKNSYPDHSLDSRRFLYWKAKSLEKLGRKEEAYEIYSSLAHSSKYDYHAFLSRLKIGHKPREGIVKVPADAFGTSVSKRKLELLMDTGLTEFARKEADKLKEKADSVDKLIYISSVYYRLSDYYASVGAIESVQSPAALFYSFPKAYGEMVERFSEKYSLDELLVYSLIREESRFDRKAVSSSDARGLMQLLPSTAVEAAGQAGITPFTLEMLYQPDINIDIGSFYLRKMLDRFNGNIALALAGYNAGPNRIAALLEDIEYRGFDEFVEKIPIFETKDYVKKILRSYGSYRAIYGYD